jgi:hypothetical protein
LPEERKMKRKKDIEKKKKKKNSPTDGTWAAREGPGPRKRIRIGRLLLSG